MKRVIAIIALLALAFAAGCKASAEVDTTQAPAGQALQVAAE